MKLTRIVYVPEAVIEFTAEDLRLLNDLSARHYDHHCRSVSQLGGFLYGLTVAANGDGVTHCLKFHEIDTLAKITELPHEKALDIHCGLAKVLGTLVRESNRVNDAPEAEVQT